MKKFWYTLALLLLVGCEADNLYQELQVMGGAGSGLYPVGTVVTIRAATPPTPELSFFRWRGDTSFLQAVRAPVTTCIIPLRTITLEAEYRALPTFSLLVSGGSGSGRYPAGTAVAIQAEPPVEGLGFTRWTGDTLYLQAPQAASTTLIMASQDLRLEAVFLPSRAVSFSQRILPLVQKNCAFSTCHLDGQVRPTLTNYTQISQNAPAIRRTVLNGSMPFDRKLARYEVELIVRWIDEGAKNN